MKIRYGQPKKSWCSSFDLSNYGIDSETWMQSLKLNPIKFIEINDDNNTEWLALSNYPYWKENLINFGSNKKQKKSMEVIISSFVVNETEKKEIINCITKKNGIDRLINALEKDDNIWYEIFEKEYYWSPAYNDKEKLRLGLKRGNNMLINRKPVALRPMTQMYFWEEEYDFSKLDTVSFIIPTKFLFDGLQITRSEKIGKYYLNNDLVCFNSSIEAENNDVLLIKKEILLEWLKLKGLSIFWIVVVRRYANTDKKVFWDEYKGMFYVDNNIKGKLNMCDKGSRLERI